MAGGEAVDETLVKHVSSQLNGPDGRQCAKFDADFIILAVSLYETHGDPSLLLNWS